MNWFLWLAKGHRSEWLDNTRKYDVNFNGSFFMGLFTGKTLMITGGTGSFGNAVLNRFFLQLILEKSVSSLMMRRNRMTCATSIRPNIINLSETENLVTVMTCNEVFNPQKPDTFFEPV